MSDRPTDNFHLADLMRHARMLVGDRDEAARLVLQALARPITRAKAATSEQRAKISLFRDFSRIVADAERHGQLSGSGVDETSDGNAPAAVMHLPLIRRQALLLADVEKLTPAEIGEILDISETTAEWHLTEARAVLANCVPANVMIIEDDSVVAMDLAFVIEEAGHKVVAIASREAEAVESAAKSHPEIILADIKLKDGGSGIAAVQRITRNADIPVIFVAAYPERLMTGADWEPTYVISKPYDSDMIRAALTQTLIAHRKNAAAAA